MANGGHICCESCTYNRTPHGLCDIFGIETNAFILCRSFRKVGQSHAQARRQWPLLDRLKPGIVYQVDNSTYSIHEPRAIYHVSAL